MSNYRGLGSREEALGAHFIWVGDLQAKQAEKGSLEEKGMRLGKENLRKDERKETSEQTPFRKIRFLNP